MSLPARPLRVRARRARPTETCRTAEIRDRRLDVARVLLAEDDRRSRQVALLAALVIHLLLITITIPSFRSFHMPEDKPRQVVYVSRWLPPPPKRPPVTRAVAQENLAARRVPVPDPSPDEPEPVREPLPEPEPIEIPPDVEVILGAPEPPPLREAPVRAGFGGVTYPVLIEGSRVIPVYPELARLARVETTLILEAVIRKDGTVGELKVLRSPAPGLGFEEAAVAAVRQWRYKPGVQDGRPVDVYFTVVVEFDIE